MLRGLSLDREDRNCSERGLSICQDTLLFALAAEQAEIRDYAFRVHNVDVDTDDEHQSIEDSIMGWTSKDLGRFQARLRLVPSLSQGYREALHRGPGEAVPHW